MEDVVAGGADGVVAEVEVLQGVQVSKAWRDLPHHHVHQVQRLQRVAAVPELPCPGQHRLELTSLSGTTQAGINFPVGGQRKLELTSQLGDNASWN